MKKKWVAGLILAMVLTALAAAAPAEPLTCREIVEQVAVPMALANDPKVGVNRSYSAEELAELARVMGENGIVLPENDTVMQMVTNGLGYFEESTISAFCKQAFAGDDESWTLEDQAWYGEIEVKIGAFESTSLAVPGPDNMTLEEAEAFAFDRIREAYGRDLQLENREVWKVGYQFCRADAENPKPWWSIWLIPQDLEHGHYSVEFSEGDRPEEASVYAEVPDWSKPYTGEELQNRFRVVWSWAQNRWTQPVWQKYHEMIQQAQVEPDEFYYRAYTGYRMTEYPEPSENDISREEAIRIAKTALNRDRAALDSAVLTEYAGERSWLVSLVIYAPWERDAEPDPEAGSWVVTVDSATGEVRNLREAWGDEAYIPEAAWEKAKEGIKEDTNDYIAIAAEAVKAEYPDLDPLDENNYTASESGLYTHWVDFMPKNVQYGRITVGVAQDGTIKEMEADVGPLDGDNLFNRYWYVYGYYANWDQEMWIRMEKDMAELPEPMSIDGQALKATHYPEESSVKIGREEAKELGVLASGQRTAEAHTCVLVDAKPHPVWIMRVITQGGNSDPVFGIDAETGETVFTEQYEIDETPNYVMYSLPETWKKLTGE